CATSPSTPCELVLPRRLPHGAGQATARWPERAQRPGGLPAIAPGTSSAASTPTFASSTRVGEPDRCLAPGTGARHRTGALLASGADAAAGGEVDRLRVV